LSEIASESLNLRTW